MCSAISVFLGFGNSAYRRLPRAHARLGEKWRPARGTGQPAAGEPGAADRHDASRPNAASRRLSALLTSVLVALAGERGALYAIGLMTVLLLVFAEVMPKTVAINYPDRTSLLVARVISLFVAIFGPVLIGVEVLVRGFLKVVGIDTSRRQSILSGHEELKGAVDLLHREGGVGRSDRDMFGGLLDLRLEVSDVMVHRTKMLALNADLPKI